MVPRSSRSAKRLSENVFLYSSIKKLCDPALSPQKKYLSVDFHGNINSMNKSLLSLSENKGKSLEQIMSVLLKAIGNAPIAAVCTGGTDSRVILAHLCYAKKKPS